VKSVRKEFSESDGGRELGIDATIPQARDCGEGFRCSWPPLIEMNATVKVEVEK
jgi:hypothetical protein